jgi:F5/8 type C domain-containing protein
LKQHPMNKLFLKLSVTAAFIIATSLLAQDTVPLKTDLPKPLFVGTPVPIKVQNLEPPQTGKRPDFMVPVGTVNLAKGKKVTASDNDPVVGTLDLITDGDKEGDEGSWVELAPGKQWVQIDLEKDATISAIMLWHFHSQARVYFDVIVQVSDDPKFEKDVTTIFNNDSANELGLGVGKDYAYIETYEGKLIDAKGVKGRYVRLYSKGNTTSKMNHYIEVEVFGKPAA